MLHFKKARATLALLILLLAAPLDAATVRWLGGAANAVKQVETITVSGTWAGSDTGTVTCGGGTFTITVGTATSTSDVAQAIAAGINGTDATPGLVGDETRNVNGQSIPQFQDFTAEASSNTVVITANTAGVPFVIGVSESTAGNGALATATTIAATGPNHADNAANWVGGSLPSGSDVMRFDSGSYNCSYGLDYFKDNTIDTHIYVTTDYTGTIGLPLLRDGSAAGDGSYPEYRDRLFQGYDADASETITITSGINGLTGGSYYFDLSSWAGGAIDITDAGTVKGSPSVIIADGDSTSFYVGKGWVAVDPIDAALSDGHDFDGVTIGAPGGNSNSVKVTFGESSTWDGTIATTVNNGTVIYDCSLDVGANETTLTMLAGTVELRGAQTCNAITVQGGTLFWNGTGSMAGAVAIWTGAVLDLRNGGGSQTYGGGVAAYGGATIHKGGHSLTPTFTGCTEDDCTITD